ECTPHHPASMAGIRCWGEATKALRDLLVPLGWKVDNTDNIPSVVNRERHIKIAITNANSGTGIELGHPQPITEKGDGTKRAFFTNQYPLLNVADEGLNEVNSGNNSIWYLCIFCGADMVRAELLCPVLDEDGLFKDFNERIALISDSDENGGFSVRRDIPESPDGESGFEINVTRKQA
ncbi:MAG: hypothetical protein ACREDS_04520, partial [Limisphaerales bacterium]